MILNVISRINAFIPNPVKTIILFASNGLIIWLFLRALLYPEVYTEWIYKNAILIFIFEFLSIHSSCISTAFTPENKKNGITSIFLTILIYLYFAVFAGFMFGNWFLPLYFIISTCIKIYGATKFSLQKSIIPPITVIFFIVSAFSIIFAEPLIKTLFPLPARVLQSRPAGASGLFIETPQTTIVWGIVYFSIYFIANMVLLIRARIR